MTSLVVQPSSGFLRIRRQRQMHLSQRTTATNFVLLLLYGTALFLFTSSPSDDDGSGVFTPRFAVFAWQSGLISISSSKRGRGDFHSMQRRHRHHGGLKTHLNGGGAPSTIIGGCGSSSSSSSRRANDLLWTPSSLSTRTNSRKKRLLSSLSSSTSSLYVSQSSNTDSGTAADSFYDSSFQDDAPAPFCDSSLRDGNTPAPLESSGEEETPRTPQSLLKSFLPMKYREEDSWKSLPKTKALLECVTENYMYGSQKRKVSLDMVLNVVNQEYTSNDETPVVMIDGISFDMSSPTGDEADATVAEILSLAAMYQLPTEITLDLLDSVMKNSSGSVNRDYDDALGPALASARDAFANGGGWKSVSFPKGFALQPATETALRVGRLSRIWSSFRNSRNSGPRKEGQEERSRIDQAAIAVQAAATENVRVSEIRERQAHATKSRDEFLSHLNAELSENPPQLSSTVPVHTFPELTEQKQEQEKLLYFPDSVPQPHLSLWKRLRRGVDKNYALLKKKGRAGFLAYAFFNFAFYSIGFVWQWRRAAPVDPFASSSATASLLTLCCRKFGRIFAYLYVISNLIKLPKIFTCAALVPVSESVLSTVKKRLKLSTNAASVVIIAILAASWIGITSIPIMSEYAQLRRLVRLDQIVHGYVVQPV